MNIPSELKYTKEHEWVRLEGDVAVIGITDFAQGELGDIVFVEVETVDESLGADEVFGTIEAVKTVSDLFMPVAGEVTEFNEAVDDDPALVNSDPYGEGMAHQGEGGRRVVPGWLDGRRGLQGPHRLRHARGGTSDLVVSSLAHVGLGCLARAAGFGFAAHDVVDDLAPGQAPSCHGFCLVGAVHHRGMGQTTQV